MSVYKKRFEVISNVQLGTREIILKTRQHQTVGGGPGYGGLFHKKDVIGFTSLVRARHDSTEALETKLLTLTFHEIDICLCICVGAPFPEMIQRKNGEFGKVILKSVGPVSLNKIVKNRDIFHETVYFFIVFFK